LSHQRGENKQKNNTKQNKKNHHKLSQVQMQYRFSVWRQFCEWLSDAVAYLPTAVSLLLLEALFMQILGVSVTLT
jgi:hypothetical protein